MPSLRPALLLALVLSTQVYVAARDNASSARPPEPKPGLSWLLPAALQSAPELDMTFFTEMSEAGRKVAPPTEEQPAFYLIHATGAHTYGDSTYRTPPPSAEDLRLTMRRTLAAAHYLEVDTPERAPDLVIVYHWGVHAGIDPLTAEIAPQLAEKNLLQRAALIGGETFATRWEQARRDDALMGAGPVGIFSSEYQLSMSDTVMRKLIEQAREDVYFVVATAYDAAKLARNDRVVLWRTKMTVSTQGVAMREAVAPLIAAAVPYLGREMGGADPISRRVYRNGRVIIGEAEVLGVVDPAEEVVEPDAAPATDGPTAGPAPAPDR